MYKTLKILFVCFSVMLLVGGCEEKVEQPLTDVDVDVAAIKNLLDEWYQAHYARDIEKLLSFYTEDAIRMGYDEPTQAGKIAIRTALKQQMEMYDFQPDDNAKIDDRAEEVRVSGDLGMARGVDITITPQEGMESVKSTVRWVAIYERQGNGTWQIICEIWNRYVSPTSTYETE